MAKALFGWSNKKYNNKYWSRMEKNWRRWKGKKLGKEYGKKKMETIPEILLEKESWRRGTVITLGYTEELNNEGRSIGEGYLNYGVTDKECDEIGEMCDPYENL